MKKNQATHFPTVSAFMHALGRDDVRHPLIEVIHLDDLDDCSSFGNTRYTFGFYCVVYKDARCGTVRYGRNEYDYDNGTLLFFAPDHNIELGTLEQSYQGVMLIFSPALMQGLQMSPYTFFGYSVNEALHVSERERQQLHDILGNIETELERGIDRHTRLLMAQNVALILNYCIRFYDRQFIAREPIDSQLMQRFTALLDDYFSHGLAARQGVPTVRYFADALNLSANYFGDLVKAQTGNSPQQLIQQHVIQQARHRLTSTTDSVSQIAYALGFEYPQYFSRLFKKQTGLTPQEYRAQA